MFYRQSRLLTSHREDELVLANDNDDDEHDHEGTELDRKLDRQAEEEHRQLRHQTAQHTKPDIIDHGDHQKRDRQLEPNGEAVRHTARQHEERKKNTI